MITSRFVARLLVALALTAIGAGGCLTADPGPQVHPKWVKNQGLPGVVIFVHGISGDATSTWTNVATKAYFPELVAGDPEFRNADVYVYEYPAPLTNGLLRINEVAEMMRLVLTRDRVLERPGLIFVAHSMGGLVTGAFLRKNRAAAEKVRFLYFFAVPTTGSDVARIFGTVSSSPQVAEVGRLDVSLVDLYRDWLAAEFSIATYCAYERRRMLGGMIVDELSAMSQCNRRADPIDADHITIVKPSDRRDAPYSALLVAYRDVEARAAAGSLAARQRVAQHGGVLSPPATAQQAPAPSTQPNIQQRSTGPNSPNIIGDRNTVIINPEVNPNSTVITYDFRGNRRETGPGISKLVIGGLEDVFGAMIKFHDERNWVALRELAEKQIKETPEWLTPALFSGLAHAQLGDIDTAILRLEHVQRMSAGNPDYVDAARIRRQIRERTGR